VKTEMTPDEVGWVNGLAAGYKRQCGFGLILHPTMWAFYEKHGVDMTNFVRAQPSQRESPSFVRKPPKQPDT